MINKNKIKKLAGVASFLKWSQGGLNPSIRMTIADSSPEVAPLTPRSLTYHRLKQKERPSASSDFQGPLESAIATLSLVNPLKLSIACQ